MIESINSPRVGLFTDEATDLADEQARAEVLQFLNIAPYVILFCLIAIAFGNARFVKKDT